jgi:hypothetical protein
MSRFSSMVPTPSFIESDAGGVGVQQQNGNPVPNIIQNTGGLKFNSMSNFTNKNNDFSHRNENSGNSSRPNNNLEGLRNKSKGEHHVKRLHDRESQFRHQNTAAFTSAADNEAEIKKTTDRLNVLTGNKQHNVQSMCQETHKEISQTKIPPTSDKCQVTVLKKVSLEKRKDIMRSFGFDTEPENQNRDSNQNKEKDLNQLIKNRDIISNRTSPRVRHNLQTEPTQSTFNTTIAEGDRIHKSDLKPEYQHTNNASSLHTERTNKAAHQNSGSSPMTGNNVSTSKTLPKNGAAEQKGKEKLEKSTQPFTASDAFLSQLDTIKNSIFCSDNVRSGSSNRMKVDKGNGVGTNGNRPPDDASKFNPFLKSEKKSTHINNTKENTLSNQRRQRQVCNPNPAVAQSTQNLPRPMERMTDWDFSGSGQLQLNVHRPVRDQNDRVLTRAQALDRIQEQYETQRAIFEAKKREVSLFSITAYRVYFL